MGLGWILIGPSWKMIRRLDADGGYTECIIENGSHLVTRRDDKNSSRMIGGTIQQGDGCFPLNKVIGDRWKIILSVLHLLSGQPNNFEFRVRLLAGQGIPFTIVITL